MKKNTTRLWRAALTAALATIGDIAEEAGKSRPLFDTYRNQRPPSRAAVLALADALEARAARLRDYSDRLREAAGDEPLGCRRRAGKTTR